MATLGRDASEEKGKRRGSVENTPEASSSYREPSPEYIVNLTVLPWSKEDEGRTQPYIEKAHAEKKSAYLCAQADELRYAGRAVFTLRPDTRRFWRFFRWCEGVRA